MKIIKTASLKLEKVMNQPRFDVLGIGNAMVDVIIQSDDAFFIKVMIYDL